MYRETEEHQIPGYFMTLLTGNVGNGVKMSWQINHVTCFLLEVYSLLVIMINQK